MDNEYLEFYKLSPTYLVIWRRLADPVTVNRYNFHDPDTPKEKKVTYQGEITPHSRRRLSKAIQLLTDITNPRYIINPVTRKRQKFHLAFWTLTLSASQDFISDHEIKKQLLEPFLRIMRKKGLRNYIWKAELQQNGNIHFHLLTDFFLPYTIIRDCWNNCQSKLGFIDSFEKRYGHRDPNSTDVRAVRSVNSLASYLAKYMLKPMEKAKQQKISPVLDQKRKGKIWDCSLNLKTPNKEYDFLSDNLYSILHNLERTGQIKVKHEEFFKLYFFDKQQREALIPDQYKQSYNKFIEQVKSA